MIWYPYSIPDTCLNMMRRVAGGDKNTPSYLKAEHSGDGETEHREGKCYSSVRVILQRWTTNKHVLCLAALISMWIISVMCRQCFYGPKKSLYFHLSFEEWDQKSTACLCPLRILSAMVTKLISRSISFLSFPNRPNGPSGAFSKMAWGHLQYYKCNKTHPQKILQICQKHIYMGSSAIK